MWGFSFESCNISVEIYRKVGNLKNLRNESKFGKSEEVRTFFSLFCVSAEICNIVIRIFGVFTLSSKSMFFTLTLRRFRQYSLVDETEPRGSPEKIVEGKKLLFFKNSSVFTFPTSLAVQSGFTEPFLMYNSPQKYLRKVATVLNVFGISKLLKWNSVMHLYSTCRLRALNTRSFLILSCSPRHFLSLLLFF